MPQHLGHRFMFCYVNIHLFRRADHPEPQSLKSQLYLMLSKFTMFTVGMGCKLILKGFNTTVVHGKEHLLEAFDRPHDKPLLTVFNHNSCFDDPGLMGGILSAAELADHKNMRWTTSASEIIYTNLTFSKFWALGKTVPVVRGWSPKQPAIDFLIERLDEGSWVNLFPEAKVSDQRFDGVYKWGVGRLVKECKQVPVFLPVYHIGMNRVLPNPSHPAEGQPMIMRPGNLITVCIGQPIDLAQTKHDAEIKNLTEEESWAFITKKIQSSMEDLEKKARMIRYYDVINWLKRWHDYKDVYFHLLT